MMMNDESTVNHFRLYDLPNEILLKVMTQLNDVSLLDMTQVCRRFRAIAKDAFAKKYSGRTDDDYYKLKVFCENEFEEYKRYRSCFRVFGENMNAIDIRFFDDSPVPRDHWLIGLIHRFCTSLAKISIRDGQQLDLTVIIPRKSALTNLRLDGVGVSDHSWANIHYCRLTSFTVFHTIERHALDTFLRNNRQIKHLEFAYHSFHFNVFDLMSGQLHELTSLRVLYDDLEMIPSEALDSIKLEALEVFEICADAGKALDVLKAISKGCKKLNRLSIQEDSDDHISWDDDCIQAICEFKMLKSISMCSCSLGIHWLNEIIQNLPDLSALHLTHVDSGSEIYENVPETVNLCSKLSKLNIGICGKPPELSVDFLTQIAATTRNNGNIKVILECEYQHDIVSTQGEVRSGNALIYWDGYDPMLSQSTLNLLDLDDRCLNKIIGLLEPSSQCDLYNTCKRTRKMVSDFISNHVFYASLNMDGRIFQSLGRHIRCMNLEIYGVNNDSENDSKINESWKRINRYCSKMTELNINNKTVRVLDYIHCIPILRWPTIRKLIFSTSHNKQIGYHTLRSFECPSLSYLEVQGFVDRNSTLNALGGWTVEEAFCNLTTLKVSILSGTPGRDINQTLFFSISLDATTRVFKDFFRDWLQMFINK